MSPLLIGVLALGGLAAAMFGSKPSGAPQPPPGPPSGATDSQWNGFAAQAAATRNPAIMRYAADQLERAGLRDQAAALRVAADAVEAANAAAAPAASPTVVAQTPGVVAQAQQASTAATAALPAQVAQQIQDAVAAAAATAAQAQQAGAGAAVPPVAATPVSADPRVGAAESLANHLRATGRYREDKDRVKAFQVMMGLEPADGQYGVSTAIAIGQLGVIPAKPFYYSRNPSTTSRMKAQWRGFCLDKQTSDPAHSAQWEALSKVERD